MTTTAIRDRPILFSAPMIRALLSGAKTQTRRIVNPQPPKDWRPLTVGRYRPAIERDGVLEDGPEVFGAYNEDWGVACKFGGPGERLWVRETWFCATGEPGVTQCHYRADGDLPQFKGLWRPSIYMPRWASRMTLELTDVRIERVQDIGKDGRKAHDVLAEGIEPQLIENDRKWFHPDDAPAIAFSRLWDSVNGKDSWEANPWVWVLSFRRVEEPTQ